MLGDIVHLPVVDDYMRLAHKVLQALRWTLQRVPTQYILKVDVDTWVDAAGVTAWLAAGADHVVAPPDYGGQVHAVPVDRTGKWGVAMETYNQSVYPLYAKGGGYFLSTSAARRNL